jgi:hypothetical protein
MDRIETMDQNDSQQPNPPVAKPGLPRNLIAELFEELKILKARVKDLEDKVDTLEKKE